MTNVELQQKVWNNLKGSADKAAKFEDLVAVSFVLISENSGELFVAVRDGQLMVEPYFYTDCGCVIESTAEVVDKIFSGAESFDKVLEDGTAKVQRGDVAKFKALECLVPAKKTRAASKSAKASAKTAAKESPKTAEKAPAKEEAKAPAKEEAKPAAMKPEAKTAAKPAAKPAVKPALKTAAKSKKKKK